MAFAAARCLPVEPLVVALERSPGSGLFEVDDRLRVDDIFQGSDATLGTARLSVRLDDDVDVAAAHQRYRPDRRLVVRTEDPDPRQHRFLFDGYPCLREARWSGCAGEWFTLEALGVYDVLARDRRAWVYGRRMRNGRIDDGLAADPARWAGRSVRVDALPCVFNPDGQPNASPAPLLVQPHEGPTRSITIFTHDADAQAVPWSYLAVLRYLVWFHRPNDAPVDEGNLFRLTDPHADTPLPVPALRLPDEAVVRALLQPPDSLDCQAVNLVDALARLADACGLHVTPVTRNDDGRPGTGLHVWSPADAPRVSLALAWGGRHDDGTPRYDAANAGAADVFAANEVHDAVLRWDARRIVNAPIVIGDVRQYEMTVPLVPGWLPETNLDDVPEEDRAAARALAVTPDVLDLVPPQDRELIPWYRMYHAYGSEFEAHRFVARRWVLNEDGWFGTEYNRNEPFDAYRVFDFATVAEPAVTTPGDWVRRPRPFHTPITRTVDGETIGVHLEVSFDAGATWFRPVGGWRVITSPTGIYFSAPNPTAVRPPGVEPTEQNLWYALIDQMFRVRVTAVFESDRRLVATATVPDGETAGRRATTRVVYRPGRFRFASRSGTTNALAGANPDATDVERDDQAAAQKLADTIARQEQEENTLITPAIPWLDTRLPIGTRIDGIPGRRISFRGHRADHGAGPVVIGRRYRSSGGRYETSLVLERTYLPT